MSTPKPPLAVVRSSPTNEPETELATVEHDGDVIVLTLDDGERLELDRHELLDRIQAA